MKKVLALMLALVFVLSLVACGGDKKDSNSDKIEITLDNYSKYLNLSSGVCTTPGRAAGCNVGLLNGGKGFATNNGGRVSNLYDAITFYASASGISQNFNYNDITIKCKLTGTYRTYKSDPPGTMHDAGYVYGFNGSDSFDKEIVLECNITGEANYSEEIILSNEKYTHDDVIDYECEVTSISGSITPA